MPYNWLGAQRKNLWIFMENTNGTFASKFMSILSILFIITSTVSFCVETLPRYDDSYINIGTEKDEIWQFNHTTFHMQELFNQ